MKQRILVALSGASGVTLGSKLIAAIPPHIECLVIETDGAKQVKEREFMREYVLLDDSDIGACVASGSFVCQAMAVVPCSMNTLAKIAHGIADNLTTRAASVFIKERRLLLLSPREMPFSAIALENMSKLSHLGVIISPPVAAYYAGIQTLEEMENFWVGKWLDILGIEHSLFHRWEG
ncbi:3-octaprenyl-4-hydroxybenzoate carboxy-lyase [Helicobacter monodelphidis]|uniref:UbiX family flavin prenyltransferase n=1 Tax=Helicobacter sp. 15-1451 TaxID=2004995 RepID=UPI000DCC8DF7|nr:UbiX family flavin prenyltransferase [Helicobacter sp. 15-1451]RAX58655.1 3-octaprenyl-4-hydroxybenzoate carboxy-lyase [Helicobacter sp. 15-1451]